MHTSTWLTATLILGVVSFAAPAHANFLSTVPRQAPTMEELVVLGPERAAVLDRLEVSIEDSMAPSNENITTVGDVIQSPLLDGLLDEDGELNLPLGLTIYDTMGDTSIGFGTEF
jgi:hypothetical protein